MGLSTNPQASSSNITRKIPSNLRNPKGTYITVFTRALHCLHLSQNTPVNVLLSYILIFSTLLRLDIPSCRLPSGFRTNVQYVFLFFPISAT
jgi:hypothetical protein